MQKIGACHHTAYVLPDIHSLLEFQDWTQILGLRLAQALLEIRSNSYIRVSQAAKCQCASAREDSDLKTGIGRQHGYLFVMDDCGLSKVSISSGWSLQLATHTLPLSCCNCLLCTLSCADDIGHPMFWSSLLINRFLAWNIMNIHSVSKRNN